MSLTLTALAHVPLVQPGDDLCAMLFAAAAASNFALEDGDIVVLAQKVVSKAEGRASALASVTPSAKATELAAICDKDARLVELILSEASEVMRVRKGVLIVRHRLGLVLANAGIDQSNIDHSNGEMALLLPVDPDATCRALRLQVEAKVHKTVGVMIIDSLGRAWRKGTVGTAIGSSGLSTLLDLRGAPDLFGRELQASESARADEIAAAASLLMGQGNEASPIVILRGLAWAVEEAARASDLVRPVDQDLFR